METNTPPMDSQDDGRTVRRSSRQIHCDTRNEPAVISVIERVDAARSVRFVLWCSLRGVDQCDERCLR